MTFSAVDILKIWEGDCWKCSNILAVQTAGKCLLPWLSKNEKV